MNVIEVKPIGFCYGVSNAIEKAKEIRKNHLDKKVYIFGMLVHNESVVQDLLSHGIVTLEANPDVLNSFTRDDVVIFTAHGHKEEWELPLRQNGVTYYDLTCPTVARCMSIIKGEIAKGNQVIYIGKSGHPEAEASLSLNENVILYDIKKGIDYSKIHDKSPFVANQTTLSLLEIKDIHDDIKSHIKDARVIDEICGATRARQQALLKLQDDVDAIIIIGSEKSSNTDKLYQVAKERYQDKLVVKVDSVGGLRNVELKGVKNVAVASGTSAPSSSIEEIENYLRSL